MAITKLASPIKTQILSVLQSLVTDGYLNSFISLDKTPDPLSDNPVAGYPFAIVGMPPVTSEMEDSASNLRTYRYDIMFVLNPETLSQPDTDVEDLIDAALNTFDTAFTLNGAAIGATVPPAQVIGNGPVSSGSKNLIVFVVRIEARTLYTIGT
jgi:hypothetical protein